MVVEVAVVEVEGLMASAAFWIFTPAGFQDVLHAWFVLLSAHKITHWGCFQCQLDHWCVMCPQLHLFFFLHCFCYISTSFLRSKVAYLTSFCFIVEDLVSEEGVGVWGGKERKPLKLF